MARPTKKGLDYFPMDTTLDFKYQLLKAKYKLEGVGFVDMLFRYIYNEGYYINLDSDNLLMLSSEFGIDENKFKEMLEFCVDKGFFSKDLWVKENVLTSNGIQKRYFHKTIRRIEKDFEFLLPETRLLLAETSVVDNKKYTNKRKGKEIKVNKIKGEESVIVKYGQFFPTKLLDNGFEKHWMKWITFNEERETPIGPTQAKEQLKYLGEIENPIEQIELSIKNNWKGLQYETNKGSKPRGSIDFDKYERELKIARGEMP